MGGLETARVRRAARSQGDAAGSGTRARRPGPRGGPRAEARRLCRHRPLAGRPGEEGRCRGTSQRAGRCIRTCSSSIRNRWWWPRAPSPACRRSPAWACLTSPPPPTSSPDRSRPGPAASSSTRTATSPLPPPPTSSPSGLQGHDHHPLLHGGRGHRRGRALRHLPAPLHPGRGRATHDPGDRDATRRPTHQHTFSGAETVLEADTVVLAFGGKSQRQPLPLTRGQGPRPQADRRRRLSHVESTTLLLEGTRVARAADEDRDPSPPGERAG